MIYLGLINKIGVVLVTFSYHLQVLVEKKSVNSDD